MSTEAALELTVNFVVLCLVGLRLSWSLIEDQVPFGPPRTWIREKALSKGWARTYLFFDCPFCIGFWAEVALVAVCCHRMNLPMPVLWPFAINMVTAPIHIWLDAVLPNE